VSVFEDANLRDMDVTTALERFQEVAQKCQNVERILAEQLPTLRKLAQKQELGGERKLVTPLIVTIILLLMALAALVAVLAMYLIGLRQRARDRDEQEDQDHTLDE